MRNNEELYRELEQVFFELLILKEEIKLPALLERFSRKLEVVDGRLSSPTLSTSTGNLFIEIFQFETLSSYEIWCKAPKLHSLVGETVDWQSPYEVEFRAKIKEEELGLLLGLVE